MLSKIIFGITMVIGCLFLWKYKSFRRFVLKTSVFGFGLISGVMAGFKLFYFLL